jgi:hypothetical protein
MNDDIRRKLEKFEREQQFMVDNAADFPALSAGAVAKADQAAIIAELHSLSGQQESGRTTAAQMFANQDELFDQLKLAMKQINLAANAAREDIPGSETKFRMPRNQNNHSMLAAARAFKTDATPHSAVFTGYGLAGTFLTDLQTLIDGIESASNSADSGIGERAEATGGLDDAAKRGMDVSRKLNSIVRIKYADMPQKLASWTVASHLERAPTAQAATDPNPGPDL